jgi:REP element-mobilizing transposase RayT
MARKPRGRVPAGVYHVWRRANGPAPMFHDDFDRTAFCNRLTKAIKRYDWTCIAFVLMTTHFHLVLAVEDDVLSPGMHDFFGPYAQGFNRRHGRYGHLRAEPFKLRPVFYNSGLRGIAKYVANNPVEAHMCELPQDWRWSSYPGSAGYGRQFPFVDDRLLLGAMHDDVAEARMLLRDMIEPPTIVKGAVPFTFVA